MSDDLAGAEATNAILDEEIARLQRDLEAHKLEIIRCRADVAQAVKECEDVEWWSIRALDSGWMAPHEVAQQAEEIARLQVKLTAALGCLDEDEELGPCGRCSYCIDNSRRV